MQKKISKIKYDIITILILIISYLIVALPLRDSFARIGESLEHLVYSFKGFIEFIFNDTEVINSSVNEFTKVDLFGGLTITFPEFINKLQNFVNILFTVENIELFLNSTAEFILIVFKGFILIFPFIIMLVLLFNQQLSSKNKNIGKISFLLKIYLNIESKFYRLFRKIKNIILNYIKWLGLNGSYLFVFILIWLCGLNILSIIIEAIAYYLYFICSFNITSIFVQLYKLVIDLTVMFVFVPNIFLIIIGIMIILYISKSIALGKLRLYEKRNCKYIEELNLVNMIVGSVNKGKTTLLTDMVISSESILMKKAYELLIYNDMLFPEFDYAKFEKELYEAIETKIIFNLYTCREFVISKQKIFENEKVNSNIYDYEFNKYTLYRDDGLDRIYIWDSLKSYAQLYFILVSDTTKVLSNLSIRSSIEHIFEEKNFPSINLELFDRSTDYSDSRYSHILDFDMTRLGKVFDSYNVNKDSFEFGIIAVSEIGKERMNTPELLNVKKADDIPNQKNDLFNIWLKMIRHNSTIDHYPFVKFFSDEQRASSWGADGRELANVISIEYKNDEEISFAPYYLLRIIERILKLVFLPKYSTYKENRADRYLSIYIFKKIYATITRYCQRLRNKYGFRIYETTIEAGSLDGEVLKKKYYVMNKKVYSRRFSTDCFSDLFASKVSKSNVGLQNIPEYNDVRATLEELKYQKSYFINDITKIMK